ncbi:MAG: hypothetical protein IRZ05_16525, partial [Micromonosporaceae bacterium]|nr:hypothetical protein [Micromonosporaceae bacterium]
PYAAPAEPYGPTAGPYPAAYTAPAAPAGVSAPPPGPPGYRAPFAPRGPYAGQRLTPPPPPPGANPPPAPRERSRLGFFTLSLVLVALGTLAALNLAGVVRVGAGGYLAATLAMVGAGLVVGAWFGRARWLIALGTLLALGLGVASAAEHIDTSNFGSDLTWRPASVAELDDQYVQNLGSAKLDLRQIDFTGHSATVTARINAGSLEVLLPPDVDTTVEAKINAGDARIFDQQWSGLRVPSRTVSDPGADGPGGGHLQLNIRANASSVEVHR